MKILTTTLFSVLFCAEERCSCPLGFQPMEHAFGITCVLQDNGDSFNTNEYYGPEGNNGRLQLSCNEQNNCSPYADCQRSRTDARLVRKKRIYFQFILLLELHREGSITWIFSLLKICTSHPRKPLFSTYISSHYR